MPHLIQRNVGMPLRAAGEIPRRPPVPDQHQPPRVRAGEGGQPGGHQACVADAAAGVGRAGAASTSRSTDGQSRQSRSSW